MMAVLMFSCHVAGHGGGTSPSPNSTRAGGAPRLRLPAVAAEATTNAARSSTAENGAAREEGGAGMAPVESAGWERP